MDECSECNVLNVAMMVPKICFPYSLTFDDVLKIQAEGRAKRLAAENEMAKMENDLKLKLLEISGQ